MTYSIFRLRNVSFYTFIKLQTKNVILKHITANRGEKRAFKTFSDYKMAAQK